jgi:hypothetical protein
MMSIADMSMSSHSIDMAPRTNFAAEAAIDWLCLAAAPAFAVMALLTCMGDGPMPTICTTDASLLTGMVPMYLLMSIFHAPPWLKLIAKRRADNKRKG